MSAAREGSAAAAERLLGQADNELGHAFIDESALEFVAGEKYLNINPGMHADRCPLHLRFSARPWFLRAVYTFSRGDFSL